MFLVSKEKEKESEQMALEINFTGEPRKFDLEAAEDKWLRVWREVSSREAVDKRRLMDMMKGLFVEFVKLECRFFDMVDQHLLQLTKMDELVTALKAGARDCGEVERLVEHSHIKAKAKLKAWGGAPASDGMGGVISRRVVGALIEAAEAAEKMVAEGDDEDKQQEQEEEEDGSFTSRVGSKVKEMWRRRGEHLSMVKKKTAQLTTMSKAAACVLPLAPAADDGGTWLDCQPGGAAQEVQLMIKYGMVASGDEQEEEEEADDDDDEDGLSAWRSLLSSPVPCKECHNVTHQYECVASRPSLAYHAHGIVCDACDLSRRDYYNQRFSCYFHCRHCMSDLCLPCFVDSVSLLLP